MARGSHYDRVMAGLVPAIHALLIVQKGVDGRIRGHDVERWPPYSAGAALARGPRTTFRAIPTMPRGMKMMQRISRTP